MSENEAAVSYGYGSDEVKQSSYNFGGNFGVTKMKKFEYITNAGKDGAEGEALDIVFDINGSEKNYRIYPVTKAFENGEEVTDPNHPAIKAAIEDVNARVTHILHCYVDVDAIRQGFNKKITSFKEFAQAAMSILPKNYDTIPLDIFLQYQYTKKEDQKQTYLEIPRSMKYGKFLSAAMPGPWKEQRIKEPSDSDRDALIYTNPQGELHVFRKNGWFVNSNFSNVQKDSAEVEQAGDAMNQATNTDNVNTTSGW